MKGCIKSIIHSNYNQQLDLSLIYHFKQVVKNKIFLIA